MYDIIYLPSMRHRKQREIKDLKYLEMIEKTTQLRNDGSIILGVVEGDTLTGGHEFLEKGVR